MHQFELTHEFLSRLEELVDAGNKEQVQEMLQDLHPADIAEILEELNKKGHSRYSFCWIMKKGVTYWLKR